MELIGYIIGGTTFVMGIVIKLVRSVNKSVLETQGTIKDEFEFTYREFATVAGESRESEKLGMSVGRIKGLYYHSQRDLLKIRILNWVLGKTWGCLVLIWIVVLISLGIGILVLDENQIVSRFIFLLGFPSVLLASELGLLGYILKGEKYLNQANEFYKKVEYRL